MNKKKTWNENHEQWLQSQGLRFSAKRPPEVRRQEESLRGQILLFEEDVRRKKEVRPVK